jgi:outer membrane protein OmpA-like peptidoglycan-associated protein
LGDGGDWLYLREPVLGVPWTPAWTGSWNVARGLAVLQTEAGTTPVLPTVSTGELAASLVLGRVARVGITAPRHHGDGLEPAWGDVSVWASFAVSDQDGEGVEGTWTFQYDAPTGSELLLSGPGVLQGTLAQGGPIGRDGSAGRWAAQVGLQLHRKVRLPGTVWQDSWQLGGGYRLPVGPLRVGAELAARLPARILRPRDGDVPIEGALAAGLQLHELVLLQGALGTGLLRGIGAPSLRAVGSVDVRPRTARDRDDDGVVDRLDRCRDVPEDPDGHEDADGCPDDDNDEDGLVDLLDLCPNRAENPNGIDDDDGCPEAAMWLVLTVHTTDATDLVQVRLGDEAWQQPAGTPQEHVVRDLPILSLTVWADGHQASQQLFDGLGKDRVSVELNLAPAEVSVAQGRLHLPTPVYFAIDAAAVDDPSGLEPVRTWLADHPDVVLAVEGRADATGSSAYNLALSERRAAWVVAWLVARGAPPDRLRAVGLGEAAAEGGAADRQVRFRVVDAK